MIAVDLPSGVSSDGGQADWPSARATLTVTFGAPKRGHVLPPACDAVGELIVADIGIPAAVLAESEPALFLLEDRDVGEAFARRPRGAHKGDFGHVLVVAGSLGKTGAAVLAAAGALRSGAGLVTVATPEPCLPIVAASRPELMTEPLPATASGSLSEAGVDRLLQLAGDRDAVVIGPGLGQDPGTRALVQAFVRACPVPILVDADGLNALAPAEGRPDALAALRRDVPDHPDAAPGRDGAPRRQVDTRGPGHAARRPRRRSRSRRARSWC